MNRIKSLSTFIVLVIYTCNVFSLSSPEDSVKYANWQNLDADMDKIMGVSTEKVYNELLNGKKSKTVVVAVIDNGVDIDHEDLQGKIWINEDEIPGNGIDDDHNGYIDDVHGWNFLGNANGENIDEAPYEFVRIYQNLKDKYENGEDIVISDSSEYSLFLKAKNEMDSEIRSTLIMKMGLEGIKESMQMYKSVIAASLNKDDFSFDELESLKTKKKTALDSARMFMLMIHEMGVDDEYLKEYEDHINTRTDYYYNPDFYPRNIIGDNPNEWSDTAYGNNNVKGPYPGHGTMVSSLIAADRSNNIGIKGIADNVKIMAIRTVPDGDEWDKDVAKAIEYAIDNGAEIINMSFGKDYSPKKEFIDKIVKKADESNVLLIHAAGNDNKNVDIEDNFPLNITNDGIKVNNWITVGASGPSKKKKEFVAGFSNYGKESVDLFAPGYEILACAPGNKYEKASGTSFSAPMVSGVAALVKSYYPELTAKQIKEIILQSSDLKDTKVLVPGTDKEYAMFSTLSKTGGLLNAYKAILLAEEVSNRNAE